MKTDYNKFTNPIFEKAVRAIDSGNLANLNELLTNHPQLANQQAWFAGGGYFEHPYLLYFVADNPVRNNRLPENITDIIKLLIDEVNLHAEDPKAQFQYTLGLVASGKVAKESGKQEIMMDLLLDAGATADEVAVALINSNINAARHLIRRGATFSLLAAVCFDDSDSARKFAKLSSKEELLTALTAAAFYGKSEMVRLLMEFDTLINGFPINGFHTHATPLHQAVSAGSLECVRLLVDAGASLTEGDKIHKGTPVNWATFMKSEAGDEVKQASYLEIEQYLLSRLKTLHS